MMSEKATNILAWLIILLFAVTALFVSTQQIPAQEQPKPPEVIFYVVVTIPDHPPIPARLPMKSLDACFQALIDVLADDSPAMRERFKDGGAVQASCVVVHPAYGSPT